MLVKKLKEVPDELFYSAKEEIDKISWESITDDRSKTSVFNTSTAIHLRTHKPPIGKPIPKTVDEWSMITECVNHPVNFLRYPKVVQLSNWILKEVNGVELGRIMIINLLSTGKVGLHIDPLKYFEEFSRFHIAFKTNENVVFHGGPDTEREHMPYKMLCRLNNRLPHSLENNSEENRIHLIVDVRQPDGNVIFT